MAKYSVILPVHNGGHYLKDCVKSILAQTYTNFNLVILENASSDDTLSWLTSLKDDRILIIPSTSLLTIEENWQRITSVPKNEFITLIGHDDILYADFLQQIDSLVNKYPDARLYHTHFNLIDAGGEIIRPSKKMQAYFTFNELLESFLTQQIDSMGTGYVMRAKDYDAMDGIPVKYPSLLFADFDLWLRLAEKGGMAVASETCFAFRIHQSTTGTSQDVKLHKALGIYVEFLKSLTVKNGIAKKIITDHAGTMLLFYCKGFSHRLLRTDIEKRNGLTVDHFIEETRKFALQLGVNNYHPEKVRSIQLARLIDQSSILRKLFLAFKKLVPKPVSK